MSDLEVLVEYNPKLAIVHVSFRDDLLDSDQEALRRTGYGDIKVEIGAQSHIQGVLTSRTWFSVIPAHDAEAIENDFRMFHAFMAELCPDAEIIVYDVDEHGHGTQRE